MIFAGKVGRMMMIGRASNGESEDSACNSQPNRTPYRLMLAGMIVAVLVFVAISLMPRFGRGGNAKLAAWPIMVRDLKAALEEFRKDCGRYPTTKEGLSALVECPAGIRGWKGPYVRDRVPCDPWGQPIRYSCDGPVGGAFTLLPGAQQSTR